jgi:hypothetical protein
MRVFRPLNPSLFGRHEKLRLRSQNPTAKWTVLSLSVALRNHYDVFNRRLTHQTSSISMVVHFKSQAPMAP